MIPSEGSKEPAPFEGLGARMSNIAAESLVGTTLSDKYAIEAFVGLGAMGTVYRAHHTSLHRTVAIKVLSSNNLGANT